MKKLCVLLALLVVALVVRPERAEAQASVLVSQVKTALNAGDFDGAKKQLTAYRDSLGITPEYLEAFSWVGRIELQRGHLAAAEENAGEVRKLCLDQLKTRKLDAEGHLPIALGASIEVQANVFAKQSERDQAVVFLQDEIKRWAGTSILMRLQKNLNLLTLEGKPVPALDVRQSLEGHPARPFAAHLGHPVVLFLWAHWCPDCKNEVAILHKLQAVYGPRGVEIIAPTRLYGYVAGGQDAPPATETKYIAQVFNQFYAPLGNVEVPVSDAIFDRFGVSTTPTLVLVDAKGIVRLYYPGAVSWETLAAHVDELFARPVTSAKPRASN